MDTLKNKLSTLNALHSFCMKSEHAVRQTGDDTSTWSVFNPSRFIYTYFTFNSMYDIDWESSFADLQVLETKEKYQRDRFQKAIKFFFKKLGSDAPNIFSTLLQHQLHAFDVEDAEKIMNTLKTPREDEETEKLRKGFKRILGTLREPSSTTPSDYLESLLRIITFIYKVRCNIFHGSKTRYDMEEESQQARFLVYSAILIAVNALLFEVAKRENLGWYEVTVGWRK